MTVRSRLLHLRRAERVLYDSVRFTETASQIECSLKFIDTEDFCTEEVHKILWTCIDLKERAKKQKCLGKPLKDSKVTMLCQNPGCCTNLVVQSAVKTLGADLRIMNSPKWEESRFKKDVGRLYSLFSDILLVQGRNHLSVCEVRRGAAPVPVVNVASHMFVPIHGLAMLMTLQEHFGRLKGLTLAWVGPMGNKLNTLIYLLPKVGVNLRYNACPRPKFPASPLVKPKVFSLCDIFHTTIEEFSSPEETIRGADAIATSQHQDKTVRIEMDMLRSANNGWVFLHILPRWEGDVCNEVFDHPNSLVWTLHQNMEYSTMGLLMDILKGYQPVVAKPRFE